MSDSDIVAKARSEEKIIITFDLDFGEIMALTGESSPSVILFRMRNQAPRIVATRLIQVVQECHSQLASGSFVTIEDHGYRLRRLRIG
jgi:predicted nuclease of predicted toxin-antitoxin system